MSGAVDHSSVVGVLTGETTDGQTVTLTLWRPLLQYGYSHKASCAARPG